MFQVTNNKCYTKNLSAHDSIWHFISHILSWCVMKRLRETVPFLQPTATHPRTWAWSPSHQTVAHGGSLDCDDTIGIQLWVHCHFHLDTQTSKQSPKTTRFFTQPNCFFFLSETLSEAKSREISELGENLWLNHWTNLDFPVFCGGFSQGVDNDVHFLSEKILKSQVRFIQSTMASVSSLHKAPLRMISPCPRAARTMASGCFCSGSETAETVWRLLMT